MRTVRGDFFKALFLVYLKQKTALIVGGGCLQSYLQQDKYLESGQVVNLAFLLSGPENPIRSQKMNCCLH